jgi:branched-chain amino acid transport system ATP-binding protein
MILEIKDLEAGYGKFSVLEGVSMKVAPDEIIALIGPNGAGKSTVLKSVFGLTTIYKGKIIYRDKDITKFKTSELVSLGISYVPQGRQVFSSLTVKENLEMGAFITNDKALIEKKMKEVFEKFPVLKEKMNDYAFSLSGGQQQMLAMGRALMQDPQLLLLDEPSLGLSPKMMKEIFDKIIEINKEGTAILIVEQNAKKAMSIAHRTYVLEDGKVALTGGKDIVKNPKIRKIYLGGR